jgi:beta-glucanase (GH16 family)
VIGRIPVKRPVGTTTAVEASTVVDTCRDHRCFRRVRRERRECRERPAPGAVVNSLSRGYAGAMRELVAVAVLAFGGVFGCSVTPPPRAANDLPVGVAPPGHGSPLEPSETATPVDGTPPEVHVRANDIGRKPVVGDEAPAAARAGWKLAWSDEFAGDGLANPADWGYEVGQVRNNEAQYYLKSDRRTARRENGLLVLEAFKEKTGNAQYLSASVTTEGKRQFLYGRLEVRARLPMGKGTWPAIWLLGTNITQVGWPKCGEIDVMENVGFEPNVIHAASHTAADKNGANSGHATVDGLSNKFFVYALEWSEDKLDFFVDDAKIYSFANDHKGNVDTWPYSKPMYLILNLAIGGSWGGQQGIDDTRFPHRYYIDYVRYYTKP